jgi:hypothetical protein
MSGISPPTGMEMMGGGVIHEKAGKLDKTIIDEIG